jgi:hypothetical protein
MTAQTRRRASTLRLCLSLLVAIGSSSAQQAPPAALQSHPVEIGASYTFLRTNLLPGCNCVSLNGGDLQVGLGLNQHLQAVAEFGGAHRGGITPDGYALTQITYTFGFRYFPLPVARLQPFAETLAGGAHALGTLAPSNNAIGGSSNAFALLAGGGVNLRLSRYLSLQPARLDYELTNFHNGQANRQNDLRVSTGVIYRFSSRNH